MKSHETDPDTGGAAPLKAEFKYRFGDYVLDAQEYSLRCSGVPVPLTPKPFEILLFLVRNSGRIVSREELLTAGWNSVDVDPSLLGHAIRSIRKALDDDEAPRFIQTVHGRGYRFLPDVTTGEPPAPAKTPRRARLALAALATVILLLLVSYSRLDTSPRVLAPVRLTNSPVSKLSPTATDGTHIYYQDVADGRYRISRVPLSGGVPSELPTPFANTGLCDVYAPNSTLLVRELTGARDEQSTLFLYTPASRGLRQLARGVYDATFHPDGRRVAYSSGQDVYEANLDGGQARKLFSIPGRAFWMRWSPDGGLLRLTVQETATSRHSVWEAQPDKPPRRMLPRRPNPHCCGNWSADGRYFVFQENSDGLESIWAHREATGSLTQLTFGPMSCRGPVIAGNSLLVRSADPRSEMVMLDMSSDRRTVLLGGANAVHAGFSRMHLVVAYVELPDYGLWRANRDGTDARRLTAAPMQATQPRWSPDGQTIAFMGREPGRSWRLYTIPAAGGRARQLLSTGRPDADPDWSPDGKSLVFGAVPHLGPAADENIRILDLQNHAVALVPDSSGLFFPRWSPDGSRLAAVERTTGRLALYDFASRKWRRLDAVRGAYPNWAHDSASIYMMGRVEGRRAILKVNARTGEIATFLRLDGITPPALSGGFLGLTPEDEPVAPNNLGHDDLFAMEFKRP